MEKVVNINNLISISDELLEEYGYKKTDKHRFVHSNLDFIDIYKNKTVIILITFMKIL